MTHDTKENISRTILLEANLGPAKALRVLSGDARGCSSSRLSGGGAIHATVEDAIWGALDTCIDS